MADTYLSPAQDTRDDEETLGLWGRVGVYSVGVATAMAIFYWGAVPSFRDALHQRGNGVETDASSQAAAAASGDDVLGRVRAAVAAEDGLGGVRAAAIGSVITLEGRVASEADRLRSAATAAAVAGVSRVDNRLVVDTGTAATRSETAAGNGASAAVVATTSPAVAASGASTVSPTSAAPTSVAPTTALTAAPTTSVAAAAAATTAPPAPAPVTTLPTATEATNGPAAAAGGGSATDTTETPTTVPPVVVADVQARLDALMALEPILFETSSPLMQPASYETLDRVAALLAEAPGTRIEIQGHTDDVGPADSNLFLSQDRAGRVLSELALRGVAFERMTAVGYGQTAPTVPNDSDANRQLNRRIHFVLS